MTRKKVILGATLGSCVHIAGIFNFLDLAKRFGYKIIFMRPPNSLNDIIKAIETKNPDIIALSYRLTPETAFEIVKSLKEQISLNMSEKKWIFGGTTAVCDAIKPLKFFSQYFDGTTTETDILSFLKGSGSTNSSKVLFPQNLVDRIKFSKPFPIFRAHFGLPSLEETIEGITKIAKAKVIDVISIGPDQNFQENYFCPEEMRTLETGAGGVPIRSEYDLKELYKAARYGNFPLLRCYSGTRHLIKMAELLQYTINNAWAATPVFWYSELDGRSSRKLKDAIEENQTNMAWHGERDIPFESNEAHHWSLRSAPDAVAVVAAFLGAYNAKKAGVKNYISQLMFDTPLRLAPRFDIAKMLAKCLLIENLHDKSFKSYRQVRTGLFSFPEDLELAKGQLASSIQMAMFLYPDIVHVVSYCEASHAATADDVIESTKITRKVVINSIRGIPNITADQMINNYKNQLITDVNYILEAIKKIAEENVFDPLIHPKTLTKAVNLGILDAPHLHGSSAAKGKIKTAIINGKCVSIDPNTYEPLLEIDRINNILECEGYSLIKPKFSRGLIFS